MRIYKALLKYGYAGFSLEILEYCDTNILIARCLYYVDCIKPEYNMIDDLYKRKIVPYPSGKKDSIILHKRSFHSGNPQSIISVKSYNNALTQKKVILQDNEGKSGVYC